jgi:hypothetical protein
MEPEGSLPHSQVSATCPILIQLDQFHTSRSNFLKTYIYIYIYIYIYTHTYTHTYMYLCVCIAMFAFIRYFVMLLAILTSFTSLLVFFAPHY